MPETHYSLKLHGPFSFSVDGEAPFELGLKQQALIALLASASDGQRTRSWLQEMLWGNVQPQQAKGSLRNALSQTRKVIGARADDVLRASRDRAILDMERVRIVTTPEDGEFLEGLDLRHEAAFSEWIDERREEIRSGGAGPSPRSTMMHGGRLSEANPYQPDQGLELLPTVAVLPFRERADEGHSGFGDALAEDVSRALSRCGMFTVISHLSCRHFGAMRASLPQVANELRAQYLITGQVSGGGAGFHVDVDLHHLPTGQLLDSKRYNGQAEAFFRGEFDFGAMVVANVSRCAKELAVKAALTVAPDGPMPSLAVHEMLMASVSMMHGADRSQFALARRMLDTAIERAPGRAALHAWRGKWHVLKVMKGFGDDRAAEARLAADETGRALDLDPTNSLALAFDGFVHSHLASAVDLAETRYRQAIEADPNDAFAWLLFGTIHAFRNQPAEAVRFTERARKLSPLDPQRYYYDSLSATAYLADGNYKDALEMANRSLCGNRRHLSTLRVRVIALVRLGRMQEARVAAEELMRQDPGFTVSAYLADHPAAAFQSGQDWAQALAEAGVPR